MEKRIIKNLNAPPGRAMDDSPHEIYGENFLEQRHGAEKIVVTRDQDNR